jgi:hypothetical protein
MTRPTTADKQPPSARPTQTAQSATASLQMTRRQGACLNQQLRQRGLTNDEAETWLCQAANVDSTGELTKRQASALIECLFRMTDPAPVQSESGSVA